MPAPRARTGPLRDRSDPPAIRRRPPRARFGTHLHFGWAVCWGALWSVLLAPGVIAHSAVRPGAPTFKRWMTPWARLLLWGAGVRVRTEVRAPLDPGRPVVFVANHQNALDVVTASAGIPYPFGFAAKASLRGVPLVGWVLARTACVFVDRSTPARTARTLAEAGARIRAGHAVLVFAEGLRTWRTALAPFRRGAFRLAVEAGVPLVPVVIDGDVGVFDERRWASQPGVVRVVLGPPIETAGRTRDDVPALMAAVRAWMERELGVEEGGGGERGEG